LARKALYKHATQVDTSAYPDDGSSPVGSNEWNADPDAQGMLGFTPATATITIASGVATPTDSICVIAAESSTSDDLDKLALANTSQYDLVYLFADTGDTITLKNTASPSADGQIKTVSNSDETLSTTSPTILIRKGNYWYGYGGGVVNAVNDIANVNITSVGDNEVLAYDNSSSKWINQTAAEAGLMVTNGNTTGSSGSCTGNAATVTTNANLTGEVTSSGNAATIADNIVDEANLKVSNTPTNGYMLTAQSGNTGGLTWAAAGGGDPTSDVNYSGDHDVQDLQKLYFEVQSSSFDTDSTHNEDRTGEKQLYIRTIDSNNEGLFVKLKKNGSSQFVQVG